MSTLLKENILNLSVAEIPEAVKLSKSDKAELDERLALYHQNPETGAPWGLVKERIKNRYGA